MNHNHRTVWYWLQIHTYIQINCTDCAEVYIRSAVRCITSHDIVDIFDFARYITAGNDAMVADFQQRGLLRQTFQCQPCGRPYSQVRWKGTLLGYQLRCPDCRAKLSLSKDSFFEGMRMPLEKAYGLMYFWSYDTPVNKAVDHLSASSATVVQWYQYFRDVCSWKLTTTPTLLGGVGRIVQIDESVMVKAKYKYNRGQVQPWPSADGSHSVGFWCI